MSIPIPITITMSIDAGLCYNSFTQEAGNMPDWPSTSPVTKICFPSLKKVKKHGEMEDRTRDVHPTQSRTELTLLAVLATLLLQAPVPV